MVPHFHLLTQVAVVGFEKVTDFYLQYVLQPSEPRFSYLVVPWWKLTRWSKGGVEGIFYGAVKCT
jgi:hypothetical protein